MWVSVCTQTFAYSLYCIKCMHVCVYVSVCVYIHTYIHRQWHEVFIYMFIYKLHATLKINQRQLYFVLDLDPLSLHFGNTTPDIPLKSSAQFAGNEEHAKKT